MAAKSAVVEMRTLLRMHVVLAMAIAVAFALTLSMAAHAATIVVNSLADPGAAGICTLRDAITAANKMTKTNSCVAGTGNDTIRFSVTGTIFLASTLPQITDNRLTIKGPPSPGITIDGGNKVQVMLVASCAALDLRDLMISHGFSNPKGGGIINEGTLVVINSTFSSNQSTGPVEGAGEGGGIYNNGTLTVTKSIFSNNLGPAAGGGIANDRILRVTNSTFSGNSTSGCCGAGGGIDNGGTLTVTNSTFSGNSAGFLRGGSINSNFGSANLKNTILVA